MKQKINIGIADDHALVRDGFVSILRSYPSINIFFEARNGLQLLQELEKHKPDILLLDIGMPVLDGIAAMSVMKEKYPETKIIVISGHSEPQSIIEYVRLGAISFLSKDCTKATLITAIQTVAEIGTYYEKNIYDLLESNGLFPKELLKERKLTENELTIFKLLCEKKTYKEIAALLNMNLQTVAAHRHKILRKTNSQDIDGLIRHAKDYNLL